MEITVNGERRDVAEETTLLALIDALRLEPKLVVAQRNEDIVDRTQYAGTKLAQGDVLELVHIVGGG